MKIALKLTLYAYQNVFYDSENVSVLIAIKALCIIKKCMEMSSLFPSEISF